MEGRAAITTVPGKQEAGMGEMVIRVAKWLHQYSQTTGGEVVEWHELADEQLDSLIAAARDLVLVMRRPTLGMRGFGRSALSGGEGEVWRAMIDGALAEKD
jgi:hypothetical protein